MDLGMKLFPNSEITDTEVNDMWNELDPPINELENNWKYSLDKPNTVVTLQQYIGTDPVVTVKSSYDKDDTTYNTAIASNDDNSEDYMFSGNDTVETVDFEEGVTLGSNIDKMFKDCINLKSVNLGNVDLSGVTSVDETFSGCPKLEEVTEDTTNGIPDTVDKSNMFTDSGISDTTETIDGIEIGPESELSKWEYTLDDTNNTVTLSKYKAWVFSTKLDSQKIIIYGKYLKNNKYYDTIIGNRSIFSSNTSIDYVTSIVFNNGIKNSKLPTFKGCENLTELKGLENLNIDSSSSLYQLFYGCKSIKSINLSKNLVPLVTMEIFYNCKSLESVNIENIDFSKVTDMSSMFYACSALTEIKGIENLNTSKVTMMDVMFEKDSALTSLDLTGWDTSAVTNMGSMFHLCSNLTEIKASRSKWIISSGCSTSNMFDNCGVSEVTYVD